MRKLILLLFTIYSSSAQTVDPAKRVFDVRCSGCHGTDGAGGEHGPTIVDMSRRGGGPRRDLRDVIRKGTNGGMPAFPTMPEPELDQIVRYVEALRAPAAAHPAGGDVAAGEAFFRGAGKCSTCHMVHGSGGLLGPELSTIAQQRTLAQLEESIRKPGASIQKGFQLTSARLRDGKTLRGLAKNRSVFDLQLQTLDGVLHGLSVNDLVSVTPEKDSLMPATTATNEQFQNLLAYVSRLSGARGPTQPAIGSDTAQLPFSRIVNPQSGDWATYHGQLSGNRMSPLKQITPANVDKLGAKWLFPIANARRLEMTPIVLDGVMYVTAANEVYALDARSGREIWHYSRPLTPGVIGDAGSAINRGVALLGDKLFLVTDHAHLLALNRISGQLIWEVEVADFKDHYGLTSAPLVVNDLVITGTSGGDEGARGFIDAYKIDTGEHAWRFWAMPAPGEPGSETWIGRAIEHGCAAPWLTGTYDASTNQIFWPTGNPCPDYNGDERKGDNLYSSSVVALDPATGKMRWYFQFTPHDLHDWDAAQTPMVVDAEWKGQPRKLLVQANRNGYFYVLDRTTGEFLLGEPFVKKITWANGIDAKGRPKLLPNQEPTVSGTKTCPDVAGATNWMSTAFNPETGLYYVMARESCAIFTKSSAWWEPGKSFYGGGARRAPGEITEKYLRALDLQTGKVRWEVKQIGDGGGWGGLLSTAGGLVFYCDDSGAFAALDAASGKPLWSFHTGQTWRASPMTYAVDGKQYLAVAAGSNVIAFALP